MTNKEKLEKLEVSVYMQPWWLDIVAKNSWDVVFCEKGGIVQGLFIYVYKRNFFGETITMPSLTKYHGIKLYYPKNQKLAKKYSFEHKVVAELLAKIPKVKSFIQTFSPSFTNHLSLYWSGYEQTTKYTYKLPTESFDLELIWSGFSENIRREIRKAEKKIIVSLCGTPNDVLDVNQKLFLRKSMSLPFDGQIYLELVQASLERGQGCVINAVDNNNHIAASWFVWDDKCVYYQGGGAIDDYVNSGVMSLVIWEGIKLAHSKGLEFDFEGSMIPSIERFFRSFGAVQTPYFCIQKENKVIRLLRLLRGK